MLHVPATRIRIIILDKELVKSCRLGEFSVTKNTPNTPCKLFRQSGISNGIAGDLLVLDVRFQLSLLW